MSCTAPAAAAVVVVVVDDDDDVVVDVIVVDVDAVFVSFIKLNSKFTHMLYVPCVVVDVRK